MHMIYSLHGLRGASTPRPFLVSGLPSLFVVPKLISPVVIVYVGILTGHLHSASLSDSS